MDSIPHPARLIDQVRQRIRLKHYSIRTEQAYVDWIRRYIHFHGKRHPAAMGAPEIETFLTDLAVARHVAAATQNQARSALLFLYREILAIELPWLDGVQPAKASAHLPVVLTRKEVADVLVRLEGTHRLIGALLYGSGMRIMEGVHLRVKDVEFARGEIVVRDGKGAKDRMTMLPRNLAPRLRAHLVEVRTLHAQDIRDGFGAAWLPNAPAQVSGRGVRLGLAVCLSVAQHFARSAQRLPSPAPRLRSGISACDAAGGARRGHCQAGDAAHCAIRSRRTCSKPATTSGPCRSYWVTTTSARR